MALGFRSSRASRQVRPPKPQPKFPRQRSVGQQALARAARLVMLGLVAAGVLLFFLGGDNQEAVVAEAPVEKNLSAPATNTQTDEDINLAGITKPGWAPRPTPAEGQATAAKPADATPPAPGQTQLATDQARPASGQPPATQTQASTGAKPSPQPQIRLYAPAASREKAEQFGNPWGIPYVGYSLEEIASLLTKKYSPIKVETSDATQDAILSVLPEKTGRSKTLALTFGAYDPAQVFDNDLLALVRQEKIPVTLFVSSRWATANSQTLMALAQEPLVAIAGHGKNFQPCSVDGKRLGVQGATGSVLELLHEVEGNARDMQRIASVRPQWFQGADGVYDRVALDIIQEDLGFFVAGHSLALSPAEVETPEVLARTLNRANDRDIVYSPLGLNQGTLAAGLRLALPGLKKAGFTFAPLPAAAPTSASAKAK